jgi:hypothetical protein
MGRYFCVSTRRIKPDTREQFERSWRSAVVEERSSFYTGR